MSSRSLVITCLGRDRPGLVGDLAGVVTGAGGNIRDSRMAILGGEFAVIMLVDTPASRVADLETALERHAADTALGLTFRATDDTGPVDGGRSYRVLADTMDHPGIVQEVARFFADQGANITALETRAWAAPHTGTPMFSLEMQVSVPATVSARSLREAFDQLCAEHDLDAEIEPLRPVR